MKEKTLKILIVEDEKQLADALAESLKHDNFAVDVVYNGIDGYDYAQTNIYDGLILDIMLPGMSGLQILSKLRREGNSIPILMLTAMSESDDIIKGLDKGADDYLTKPFVLNELLARVRALVRRKSEFVGDVLKAGKLCLHSATHELSFEGKSVKLSAKEYQIMEMLIANQNQIISKESFTVKIWGYDSEAEYNNIEVYISFLRRKLSALNAAVQIKAVRGVGYTLEQ